MSLPVRTSTQANSLRCHFHAVYSVFLVFEYAEHDLGRLLDSLPKSFSMGEVKCLMRQVCKARRGASEYASHWYARVTLLLIPSGDQSPPVVRPTQHIVLTPYWPSARHVPNTHS